MAGYNFTVSGSAEMARDTVYSLLRDQGFKVTPSDDWSALAERGSKGASIALGALAGKSGRHVKLDIRVQSNQGNTIITLVQGTSGASGGLIGARQAKSVYGQVYDSIGATLQNAGVLIASSQL
jgi:hypothetical protein